MRVLILIDAKNFEQGFFNLCNNRKEFRFLDFYKISNFILQYLKNNVQYKEMSLEHLRTYFYTGEYSENLLQKIEKLLTDGYDNNAVNDLLTRAKKDREKQINFFKLAKNYYFFEVRAKPLQLSYSDLKIVQKGVDVQLAVDLVDFAHKNIFDIAVVLSGDIDLLESVKTVKNMGKQVIILGDKDSIAEEMKKYADFLIDISRFTSEQLDAFSHVPKVKKDSE